MSAPDGNGEGGIATDRWRRVELLYHEMLARPEADRASALAAACHGDAALRAEVQSLLDQPVTAAGFLATPAMNVAARVLSPESSLLIAPGTRLGPYEIETLLGAGGMGRVFRARDTRLGRAVAIKICHEGFSGRFEREARAIAALSHPRVCALYDVGPNYLVMELVEGETLASVLATGPRPVDETLHDAAQIADALAAAHEHGIVHRDLKPANVMITPTGVKVLDFGLAKHATTHDEHTETMAPSDIDARTKAGQVVGTVDYMSPEQAEGKPVDARSDIFAFGVVLYEMLCGRRPFRGETTLASLASTLKSVPDPPRRLRKEIPERAERIVLRCLEKRPEARYDSARELHRDLVALGAARTTGANGMRVALIAVGLTVAVGAAAWGVRSYVDATHKAWVERVAVPDITRLIEENRTLAALKLFRVAAVYAPASRRLLITGEGVVTGQATFRTEPKGARIYISDYVDAASDDLINGQFLGETPFEAEVPRWGYYRVRAVKEGFVTAEGAYSPGFGSTLEPFELTLHAEGDVPSGMVWVPAGTPTAPAPAAKLSGFWIDKYEVSNRRFKAFVDAGGYTKQEYWTQPFVKDGRVMLWQEARKGFRDATGQPGPAGWQLGTYPEGADALPVGGLSWYEAAAYAEFTGNGLPTVYEWFAAAAFSGNVRSYILPLSNFGGRADPVGANRGMSRFGSYDMAGNLKEWVANLRDDQRYVLGGSWDEPSYVFNYPGAKPPISRDTTVGFRLVKRVTSQPEETFEAVKFSPSAVKRSLPVGEQAFQIFKDLHAYDKTEPLDATVESDDEFQYWRRLRVSFRAAYGAERVIAHLFLPKNATPPYQIVAFFGHSGILETTKIDDLQLPFEFVVRLGRALIIPAYSGSLERVSTPPTPRPQGWPRFLPPNQTLERALHWSMDLGRSIDYLETRPDIIDTTKLAFYGVSMGAAEGTRLVAVDRRFRAAVLASGGLFNTGEHPPEVDPYNFAPRVHIPVLMLNGRDDFIFPVETHQRPLFEALGTREPLKKFSQYDGGHANILTRPDLIGEILAWLDQCLGPVNLRTEGH